MEASFFTPLRDPLEESEVKLTLQRSADARKSQAIERQAKVMGGTLVAYLRQALAATQNPVSRALDRHT